MAEARTRGLGAILRSFSIKALSLAVERACRMLLVVISAPILGEDAFGRFQFASTLTAFLAVGTDLGLGVWTTRTLARDPASGARVIRVGLQLRMLSTLPFAFAVALTLLLSGGGEVRVAIALLAVAALANTLIDQIGAVLRGYELFGDEARLNSARAITNVLVGLGSLAVARSLPALCLALAVAGVAGVGYGLAILHHRNRLPARLDPRAFERVLARQALGESVRLWLAALVSMLYFKADTLFVRAYGGDGALGLYAAAYKLFEGAMLVPGVLVSVTFPELARAHGDHGRQRKLELRIAAALFGLGVLVASGYFFAGAPIVAALYGPSFAQAVPSLRVLALGQPLLYLNLGLTHFLVARDLGRLNLAFACAMLVLNVALNFAFIPRGGGPGAALATVLTEAALTLCCLAALAPKSLPGSAQRPRRAEARTDRKAA
jgi:O-antigen/teichoic acid export membrane protein